jgi:pyridoxine 4-dehydrogenase
MSKLTNIGTFKLGSRTVNRVGYGAMQLAGPGVFGPPKDRSAAVAVLREAIESGVDHIDTADTYGPYVTNQIVREALHPYPKHLVIVTKLGAKRGPQGTWEPAASAKELRDAVESNLENLGLDVLEVVNLRVMFSALERKEGSIEEQMSVMLDLQREGKIQHIGLSHVTPKQVAEGRRMGEVVCVQNLYNIVRRDDDTLIDDLAAANIPYVPFFPLGGFSPVQSETLAKVAKQVGATPMQIAQAWLLRRSPNILLIPGTSRLEHLRENLAVAMIELPDDAMTALDHL